MLANSVSHTHVGKQTFLNSLLVVLFFTQGLFARDIRLIWIPNSEHDLAGYNIYYGEASRQYEWIFDVGDTTQFTIGLDDTTSYYFAATAYDTAGNESGFSNEVHTDSLNVLYLTAPVFEIEILEMLDINDDREIDQRDWYQWNQLIKEYWGRSVK